MTDFLDPHGRTLFTKQRDDGATEVEIAPGQAVCDFCMAPNPSWNYPCGQMRIVGHAFYTDSDDDWAACEECHEAIESCRSPKEIALAMLHRQMEREIDPTYEKQLPEDVLIYQMTNLTNFMVARTGPAEAICESPKNSTTP